MANNEVSPARRSLSGAKFRAREPYWDNERLIALFMIATFLASAALLSAGFILNVYAQGFANPLTFAGVFSLALLLYAAVGTWNPLDLIPEPRKKTGATRFPYIAHAALTSYPFRTCGLFVAAVAVFACSFVCFPCLPHNIYLADGKVLTGYAAFVNPFTTERAVVSTDTADEHWRHGVKTKDGYPLLIKTTLFFVPAGHEEVERAYKRREGGNFGNWMRSQCGRCVGDTLRQIASETEMRQLERKTWLAAELVKRLGNDRLAEYGMEWGQAPVVTAIMPVVE